MPTVTVTFVQATYFLPTFVHIYNISAVTEPILTKSFDPIFRGQYFLWTKMFLNQTSLNSNFFRPKIIFRPKKFFGPKIFGPAILLDPKFFLDPKISLTVFLNPKDFRNQKILRTQNFFTPIIFHWTQKFLWTQYLFGTRRLPLETREKAFPCLTL